MKCIIFVIVFLSFFAVSCSGEEPNLTDNESKTDESIDENPDEDVVEENDEVKDDTVSNDEDTTEIDTESEEENDSDIDDQEIVYTELQSLEECKNSSCSEICFLLWDEGANSGKWCEKKTSNSVNCDDQRSFKFKLFVDNFEKCFFSVPENSFIGKEDAITEGYKIPLEHVSYLGTERQFSFFFREEKELRMEGYVECYDAQAGRDTCKEFGLEVVEIEGVETFFGGSFYFVFVI
ncbi:MAG: hypothetical protein WC414_02020 [Patescibacteria group bacterium]